MMVPHEPWLVALSVGIAVQGSFVGLSLARELDGAEGFRRRLVLAGASLTLATGVWSMHFVAMLAANFPSAIDYLVLPTLLSFLICVIVVGSGVDARGMAQDRPRCASARARSRWGSGISLMHYVGMSAVHLAGPTYQETPYVVASVIVSVGASGYALGVLDSRPTKAGISIGALALGLAISGMHYTAMADVVDPRCFDVASFVVADFRLSRNALALLTTLVAFGVSGAFLLSRAGSSTGAGSRPRRPGGAVAGCRAAGELARARCHSRGGGASARRARAGDPRREGRTLAGYRARGHFRRPRQRALHLHL